MDVEHTFDQYETLLALCVSSGAGYLEGPKSGTRHKPKGTTQLLLRPTQVPLRLAKAKGPTSQVQRPKEQLVVSRLGS